MEKTDWNAYYARPYASAKITRKLTANLLEKLIKAFCPVGPLRMVELGGANSCFYEQLSSALQPATYDVVDNNELGLEAFRKKMPADASSAAYSLDVLSDCTGSLANGYDLCFSVGLVEHFAPEDTMRAVATHFNFLKPGGIALITYPTPTWLYRLTRAVAELSGQWIFWDERPLREDEVLRAVKPHGEVLKTGINWPIFLTQGFVVVRKSN
ncbi:MAG: class I SAM-dependent methyltransferase [Verrucomicrobiaceae bacterium]